MKTDIGLPWKVVYDGASRPMLETSHRPSRMFSVDEFIDGKWTSFDDECDIAERIVEAINKCE